MRIEHDKDIDAAYVYLAGNIGEGESKKTIRLNENIILDFDSEGKLIGVEILNASKVLNSETLAEADSAR